jgi:hypothetical protein
MIKLTDILNEVKIARPVPYNLKQLEQIKAQIDQTQDKATKIALAIKAAELVLPIWEHYYPKDDRPRKAIKAAKSGNTRAAYYAAADAAADAIAARAAAAARAAYAAYDAYYATRAAANAVYTLSLIHI